MSNQSPYRKKYYRREEVGIGKENLEGKQDGKLTSSTGLFHRIGNSDTIFVASITLLAYISVFGYGVGYCAYFSIPFELISFDFAQVVVFFLQTLKFIFIDGSKTTAIILALIILYFYLQFVINFKNILLRAAVILMIIIIGCFYFFFDTRLSFMARLPFLYGLILIPLSITYEYWNCISYTKNRTLKNFLSFESTRLSRLFSTEPIPKLSRLAYVYIFGVTAFLVIFSSGFNKAGKNINFLVANTTPECAVLYYINQDTIICSPFDRNTKELEPVFKFIKISESKDIEFRQESIGPLHPKPTPTPTLIPTLTPTNTPVPTITASPTQ